MSNKENTLATEAAQPEGWVPSGWKLVPVEPTEAMLSCMLQGEPSPWNKGTRGEFYGTRENMASNYAAMLTASPTPPAPLRADAGEVERLREAYNAVAYWPEKRGDPMTVGGQGFIDLLALRNLVGEMLPALTARQDAATDALTWFGTQRRLLLDFYSPMYGDDDDQSEEWRVTKESRPINDREWNVIGRGDTPLAAINAARAALATQENNHAG